VAGPTVVVRILGDLSKLSSSFKDAESKGSSAAKGMHEAFSGMLSALNQTGILGPFGDALDQIDSAVDKLHGHIKDIGPAMMGIGGALAGVGVGLSALGSKDQAAHQQLQAAVEATGKSYDDYEKQVESAIGKQEKFGHTANQTQDALRILTQATNDPAKALQYLGTASDLAAAKHISLEDAAGKLGKAYNGNTKVLKEFGIQVAKAGSAQTALKTATTQATSADANLAHAKRTLADIELVDAGRKHLTVGQAIQLRNAQEGVRTATAKAVDAHKKLNDAQLAAKNASNQQGSAITTLAGKLHGQASAAADTFGGHISAIKAHVEDVAAAFGQKYGPAITTAGGLMAGLGGAFTATQGIMKTFRKPVEDAAKAVKDVQKAEEAAQGASSLLAGASGIGLVVLAVLALIAIGYLLWKNWDKIWGWIKDAVKVVWDWIKNNWPLLLAILLGPIGIAAGLIAKHWKAIWDGVKAVWNWIRTNWPLLLAIITGPIGLAVLAIIKNRDAIINAFKAVWNWLATTWQTVYSFITAPISAAISWIVRAWGGLLGWFSGLGGTIARIAAGMWHGVTDAFNAMVGALVGMGSRIWSWLTGIPGQIARVASGMWGGIVSAFRGAINAVIDIWNGLHFKLPSINLGPVHLGGNTIGVPQIPHLAQGGLITATGIVMAHAGEVISPIDKVPRGPAVVINNATFADDADLEAFMRKAAWYVQTARI